MLIKVKVFPESGEIKVKKKKEDEFEVKLKAPPENQRANNQLFRVLSSYFNIDENKINIKKGFKRRNKILEIRK